LREEVVVQPAVGLGKGFLDDVGRVHTGGQARVEAHRDHAAQPVPMPDQKCASGRIVPGGRSVEQSFGVGLVHTTLLYLTLPARE
jgi:hypothetical protein